MIEARVDRSKMAGMFAAVRDARLYGSMPRSGAILRAIPATFVAETTALSPSFAGSSARSNCTPNNPTLDADSVAFWGAGGSPFWGLGASLFWGACLAWSYQFTVTPSAAAAGNRLYLVATPYGSPTLTLEYRDGVGAWTPYTLAGVPTVAGHTYEFRISGAAQQQPNGLVALSSYIAIPAKVQKVRGFNLAAGTGTRLPLTLTFAAITNVGVTLLPYSGATTCEVVDLNPSLGPLVRAKDSFGNVVFGVVDADIIGY